MASCYSQSQTDYRETFHILPSRLSCMVYCRDHFVCVPSQWEMMLHCNVISHWLSAYTDCSLILYYGYVKWALLHLKSQTVHLFIQQHVKLTTTKKDPSFTLLAFCVGNPPVIVDSPHKGPVMWKAFSCHDLIMMGELWDVYCIFWGGKTHLPGMLLVVCSIRINTWSILEGMMFCWCVNHGS